MMPTQTLWLLMFVSSSRWLAPGNVVRGHFSGNIVTQYSASPSNNAPELRLPSNEHKTTTSMIKISQRVISYINMTMNFDRYTRLTMSRKSVEEASLSGLLAAVVQQNLKECRLVLVYDATDLNSAVVQDLLLLLPNQMQVGTHVLSSFLSSGERYGE